MDLSPFRFRERTKATAKDHRRNPRTISNSGCGGACVRALTPRCQRGKPRAGTPYHSRTHRPVHRGGASALPRCSTGRRTGQLGSNFIPMCEVVQIGARQVGPAPLGELPGTRLREAGHASGRRGMAELAMAVAEKPGRPCPENRALHLQRDEAYVQVRRQVGLHQREPDGRKTGRAAAWLYQALEAARTTDGKGVLLSLGPLRAAREVGRGLCGMAGPAGQRSVWPAVARRGFRRGRGLVPTRPRPGTYYALEDRSFAHAPAYAGGGAGVAAPVAVHHSLQSTERLDLCLAVHRGPASVLACTIAQNAYQARGACGWPSWDRLAQLPAHGKRLGQGGGSRTRGRENASPSRGHRNHLERVWRSGDEGQAANSTNDGRIRQAASV